MCFLFHEVRRIFLWQLFKRAEETHFSAHPNVVGQQIGSRIGPICKTILFPFSNVCNTLKSDQFFSNVYNIVCISYVLNEIRSLYSFKMSISPFACLFVKTIYVCCKKFSEKAKEKYERKNQIQIFWNRCHWIECR